MPVASRNSRTLYRLVGGFLFRFSCQGGRRDLHSVVRQSERGSAGQSHTVAWQAVEIRATSSVDKARGMTIEGQKARVGGVGSKSRRPFLSRSQGVARCLTSRSSGRAPAAGDSGGTGVPRSSTSSGLGAADVARKKRRTGCPRMRGIATTIATNSGDARGSVQGSQDRPAMLRSVSFGQVRQGAPTKGRDET